MTLVVARLVGERVAVASDTMISEHDVTLPLPAWVLKSFCLPGGICVSYSGSPDLAANSFREFRDRFPNGTGHTAVVTFFEDSSLQTNNDYLIAFAKPAKLVTVRDGRRTSGLERTHWIGDKTAFERFRQYEQGKRQYEQGRAVNVALFSDEMEGSPASNLYSILRNLVIDRDVPSVGGFVAVLSNRDIGFRFSAFSDVLMDWPTELDQDHLLQLNLKVDLRASEALFL